MLCLRGVAIDYVTTFYYDTLLKSTGKILFTKNIFSCNKRSMKVVISFKVDKEVRESLRELAQKENRSLSNYIQTLLLNHLKEKNISWQKKKSNE